MEKVSKILMFVRRFILNKYSIVIIGFGVYITFFDTHSLIKRHQSLTEIRKLEDEHRLFLDEIKKNKEMLNRIKNDSVFLEKYAREQYHMKKDGEDVFIFR